MLVDERVIPFLVKAAETLPASQKATGSSDTTTLYIEAFKKYRTWQNEYINPFTKGLFADDLKRHEASLSLIQGWR
jgi:hypothetical protein